MVVRALHLVNLGLAASLFFVKLRKALFYPLRVGLTSDNDRDAGMR
jgi:hypothetical protein